MTKRMMRRRLLAVAGLLVAFVGAVVLARLTGGAAGELVYEIATDFVELEIAIAAVYLAHVFQQRSFFVEALRTLWSDIIVAKNELIQYSFEPDPDQASFGKAHRVISRAIDEMRGVYSNVGESRSEMGVFPYQPLRDMRDALDELGFTNLTEESRTRARKRILRSWHALRFHFRNEFYPPEPTHPVTDPDSGDPRAERRKAAPDMENARPNPG